MPARSASMAGLSPKPLIVTFGPAGPSALAIASPIPEVEPVTTADFPLSMADILCVRGLAAARGELLHCNISPLEDACEPYQNTVTSDQPCFDKRLPEG